MSCVACAGQHFGFLPRFGDVLCRSHRLEVLGHHTVGFSDCASFADELVFCTLVSVVVRLALPLHGTFWCGQSGFAGSLETEAFP